MDHNLVAKRAFEQGVKFARKNGSDGLLVPPRLAKDGPGDGGAPRVAVCVTTGDTVTSNFAIALAALEYMMGQLKLPFFLFNMKNEHGPTNRNAAIDCAMNHECSWCLLLGPTLTFPPNLLARLLNLAMEHKVDVIGVASANRAQPHNNTALAKPGNEPVGSVATLVEVGAMAPGCLLIHLPTTLAKMKMPYFRNPSIEDGAPIPPEYADVLAPGAAPCIIDDTVYFCLEARRLGCRVMMDTQLSVEIVNWGEAGYKLTGAEDPKAPQYNIVELGTMPTAGNPAAPASDATPAIVVPE